MRDPDQAGTVDLSLEKVRQVMKAHRPAVVGDDDKPRAAVACLIGDAPADVATAAPPIRILFIERATRDDDPWSGHIAFPGGKMEPSETDPRLTAERETLEEIGLELDAAEYLGRLDDISTATIPVLVSAFVYGLAGPVLLSPNYEVDAAFWFPAADLVDPGRQTEFILKGERAFPAIDLMGPGRPLLWGVTYRFVTRFLQLLGVDVPPRPRGE